MAPTTLRISCVGVLVLMAVYASGGNAAEVQLAEAPPTQDRYAQSACVQCHRDQEGRLKEIVDEWTGSVHYENNVACRDCHGGDAALTRDQFVDERAFKEASHASFTPEYRFLRKRGGPNGEMVPDVSTSFGCKECHAWSTETGAGNPHQAPVPRECTFTRLGGLAVSRERAIAYICASCHPKTAEKQLASPHGSRGAPSCLYCHGNSSHATPSAAIDIIDTRSRQDRGRCSLCHQADTMKAIVYLRETLSASAERIKTAKEQFGKLEQMGYRNLGLAEMNAHVEVTWNDLRKVQHGCNLGEINELAKSIENVAKRTAYDHDLVLAVREARRRQTRIALGVAALLLLLAFMLLLYKRTFCVVRRVWTTQIPVRRTLTPPCNAACPAGNNVQGFVAAAAKGDNDRALEILLETTPFPSVCGRVCPAPCMDACNRNVFDESINVRELERYVGDHGQRGTCERLPDGRDRRIAVIGSGPAGLSATYHLARLGYSVTIFERNAELGGVMRSALPAYRLPGEVLDREINGILEHGVTVRTGCAVDRSGLVRLSHEYDAVFAATGLQNPRRIDSLEGPPEAVQEGLRFLEHARNGRTDLSGKNVVVIGGGNVAIDVARTAVRLSAAAVSLYCLESREQMPAHSEEIDEARAEGVEIHPGWGPMTIRRVRLGQAGGDPTEDSALLESSGTLALPESGDPRKVLEGSGARVEFRRCVAVFDEDGTFAPSFDDNHRVAVDADTVIAAVGQAADVSILPAGSAVRDGEALLALSGAPILSGGDFAVSEGTVAAAIGSGRRAAWKIHKILTGEDLFPAASGPVAQPFDIRMLAFPHSVRAQGAVVPPESRRTGFAEVHLGLSGDGADRVAAIEAQRCFSCGVCNLCDRCIEKCPEGIISRDGGEFDVQLDYCKSCGTCAAECHRGVIYMVDI